MLPNLPDGGDSKEELNRRVAMLARFSIPRLHEEEEGLFRKICQLEYERTVLKKAILGRHPFAAGQRCASSTGTVYEIERVLYEVEPFFGPTGDSVILWLAMVRLVSKKTGKVLLNRNPHRMAVGYHPLDGHPAQTEDVLFAKALPPAEEKKE